jgi:hypothetical protein
MPVNDIIVSCGDCKFPLEEDPHIILNERTPCPYILLFHALYAQTTVLNIHGQSQQQQGR